jgi:hypothetical protein
MPLGLRSESATRVTVVRSGDTQYTASCPISSSSGARPYAGSVNQMPPVASSTRSFGALNRLPSIRSATAVTCFVVGSIATSRRPAPIRVASPFFITSAPGSGP